MRDYPEHERDSCQDDRCLILGPHLPESKVNRGAKGNEIGLQQFYEAAQGERSCLTRICRCNPGQELYNKYVPGL
jgi:hypothetical protein